MLLRKFYSWSSLRSRNLHHYLCQLALQNRNHDNFHLRIRPHVRSAVRGKCLHVLLVVWLVEKLRSLQVVFRNIYSMPLQPILQIWSTGPLILFVSVFYWTKHSRLRRNKIFAVQSVPSTDSHCVKSAAYQRHTSTGAFVPVDLESGDCLISKLSSVGDVTFIKTGPQYLSQNDLLWSC